MKPKDIKIGKTYINNGAGRTKRKVLGINECLKPGVYFNSDGKHPNDIGVEYLQIGGQFDGRIFRLYLKSFAAWAKSEI